MDRATRRLLVLSTMIATSALLLMVSLTRATTPTDDLDSQRRQADSGVVQAVGRRVTADGEIHQVVGKQLQRGETRPGLFQILSGEPSGDTNHSHPNMRSNEPRGLLDNLFSNGSSSEKPSRARPSTAQVTRPAATANRPAATANRPANRGTDAEVNWDGIPYHQTAPRTPTRTANAPTPIRDPRQSTVENQNTRIIRGGMTAAATPTIDRRPAAPIPVPTPPRDIAPSRSSDSSLSATASSRRSDRRDVETYTAPIPTRTSVAVTKPKSSNDDVVDLIPRVSRREITGDDAKPVAKPQTEKLAAAPEPKLAAPAPKPESTTTAKADPVARTESATTNKIAAVPSATLAPPSAVPTPAYNVPVDPSKTAIPPAPALRIPDQPYAASTPTGAIPSLPVSHRAGPPTAAFLPAPTNTELTASGPATNYGSSQPTAIGSGVESQDNFGAATQLTHPYLNTPSPNQAYGNSNFNNVPSAAPAPMYETARATRDPFDDPYGRRDDRLAFDGQLPANTYGQREPAPATAAAANRAFSQNMRPGNETTAFPMRTIDGYQSTPSLNGTTPDARNQMRSTTQRDVNLNGSGMTASELPGIRVVTHGPDSVMIRQTNEYEIRVENRGSIDAEGLIVRAMIPDWAEVRGQTATRGSVDSQGEGTVERLVWTIDSLPAGSSEQLVVRLMAARSGSHDVSVDWTLMPRKSVTHIKVQEPRLDLSIEGPEEVVYGQSQTYTVRVLNPGDGVAPNVVFTLSPNSATPQSQRIGDIPAGKEAQFDVELTAQDLGDLKIHGLAIGDLDLRAESSKTIRVSAAQIEALFNGPEVKYQNTEALYNLQVQNVGSAITEKVVATLRIPAGVKYLGGIEGAELRANTLRWEIKSLSPGATRDYQFRCNMDATGEHLFAFDCKGTAAGYADVSLTTRVESISDLVLTINDPIAPAPIGSEVTYEIVIRNRGSREARDVKTLAQFSHGIEPKRIDGQTGEVVTGQVLFEPISRIAAGEEVRLKIVAIADRAGHHRFRTEVRSGDTVLVAEEATHFMSPQADRVSRRSSDSKTR